MRLLVLGVLAATFVGACSAGDPSPDAAPSQEVAASPTPENRGITLPDELTLDNVAFGSSAQRVDRAIADLKKIDFWKRLTDHLYVVKFGSRLGRSNIPTDGHLADAFLTVQIDGDLGGPLCDVRFYPTAMKDDLERWRAYFAQGLLDDQPPSLRQFWASIMAHELSHCFVDGPNGERVAQRWEERALAAVRAAGLP